MEVNPLPGFAVWMWTCSSGREAPAAAAADSIAASAAALVAPTDSPQRLT